MDSQWFHGAGARSNGIYNRNDEGNAVDLTLKLGLPIEDKDQSHLRQHVNHVPTTPNLANFNFNGHYTHQEASNSYGMVREGGQGAMNHYGIVNREAATGLINYRMVNQGGNAGISNPIGGQDYNSWTPEMGNSSSGIKLSHQYSTGAMVGVPAAYPNFNGGLPVAALPPFPTPNLNSYTVIDSSPMKVATDDESGSSSAISCRNKDSRRQRYGTSNIDPNKRCTNYNCNTNDTPMWRKGPLGPKTLCNACGIKYRKEGEKRRAKEAAKNSNSNPQK